MPAGTRIVSLSLSLSLSFSLLLAAHPCDDTPLFTTCTHTPRRRCFNHQRRALRGSGENKKNPRNSGWMEEWAHPALLFFVVAKTHIYSYSMRVEKRKIT